MVLALNNLQRLICQEIQTTDQQPKDYELKINCFINRCCTKKKKNCINKPNFTNKDFLINFYIFFIMYIHKTNYKNLIFKKS